VLHDLLYEENSFGVFLLVTVVLGGGAAWLAARAIALNWRPWWNVAFAALLIGLAVRFIHFALFGATLLSPHYYVVDTIIVGLSGLLSYRVTRARQMARQYGSLGHS
jgi:NO-binding membrane sensor protein with MHYT domain